MGKRTPEEKRAQARTRQQKFRQRRLETVEKTALRNAVTQYSSMIPEPLRTALPVECNAEVTHLEACARALRKGFAQRFEMQGAGQWMQANHPSVMDLARWALSVPEDKRREIVGRALDAFFRDSYARAAGYPIKLLAQSPQKYALVDKPAPKPAVDPELEALRKARRERERRPWN